MRITLYSLCTMLMIVSFGCEKRFTNIDEYENFVRGNASAYARQIVRNGVRVTARYLSTDELLIQNYRQLEELKRRLQSDTSVSRDAKDQTLRNAEDEIAKVRAIYENSIYFTMTMGYEDGQRDVEYERLKQGFGVYSEWTRKLQFRMNEYITLETTDAGEVPLSLYRMERTFGMTKDRTLLLAFPEQFNGVKLKQSSVMLHVKEFGLRTGNLSIGIDTKNTVRLVPNAL
jgi:hypothetical protein